MRLSSRASAVEASGIRRVFDLARTLEDPVDLSIGQPDFRPPRRLVAAAARAMARGMNRYLPTAGLPELIEAVRRHLGKTRRFEPEAVMITGGVSGGLTLAFLSLLDQGDQYIVPDPYFVSYKHLGALAGARPRFADTYPSFRLKAAALPRLLSKRTRFLLFASPANPTGVCLSAGEIKELADFARAHRLPVVSDEIYDAFSYDHHHRSIASHYPEATLLLGGFAKSWGAPGWRIGYAAGPAPLIDAMARLQQYTFVCAPAPFQAALAECLEKGPDAAFASFRRRRDLLCHALHDRYRIVRPGGAFYLFPEVPRGFSGAAAFTEALARERLMAIPGGVFSERDTHFRLSYALPLPRLLRGISILKGIRGRAP